MYFTNEGQIMTENPENFDLEIQWMKLNELAKMPTKAYDTDQGWDLYSIEDVILSPKQTSNISTGLAVMVPKGWGYSLRGRSSLNMKGIQTLLGTIDSYFTNNLYAILYNGGDKPYEVKKGDRVAQIIFERVYKIKWNQVEQFTIPEGGRNKSGLGSSGK